MKLHTGMRFNGEWRLLDFNDTTRGMVVSPESKIVLAFTTDESNSIRDKFVTWDATVDLLTDVVVCFNGHYFDNIGDAVADFLVRVSKFNMRVEEERAIKQRGMDDGSQAAGWIVDGNTPHPVDVLTRLINGIEDGDPQIMDELPQPRLGGEFADDPTWEDILKSELDEYDEERVMNGEYDDLEDIYRQGWAEGVEKQIRHAHKVYSDPVHGRN